MEAVAEARLHKGAVEARYGGRLSGVVDIEGRAGDSEEMQFQVGASLLSANGLAAIPLFDRGSLLLAGRRSFQSSLYDKILGQVDTSPAPRAGASAARLAVFQTQPSSYFYDLNAKLSLELTSRTHLTASAYNGRDNVDNSRDLELPDFALERLAERGIEIDGSSLSISDVNSWENLGASLALSHEWSEKARSVASLGFSTFENLRDRSAGGLRRPGGDDTTGTFRPRAATGSAEDNKLRDLTFRLDNSLRLGWNHQVRAGIQVTSNQIDYLFGVEEETEDDEGTTSVESGDVLDLASDGSQLSAYVQDRWTFLGRATLNAGVRFTSFDVTSQTYVEPRVSMSIVATDGLRLKGAWEKHNQFVSKITREDVLQGNREFWALSDDELIPVASATQIMAGMSYETGNFLVDVELYSKNLDDLTEFAPRFLLLPGQQDTNFADFFYQGSGVREGRRAARAEEVRQPHRLGELHTGPGRAHVPRSGGRPIPGDPRPDPRAEARRHGTPRPVEPLGHLHLLDGKPLHRAGRHRGGHPAGGFHRPAGRRRREETPPGYRATSDSTWPPIGSSRSAPARGSSAQPCSTSQVARTSGTRSSKRSRAS